MDDGKPGCFGHISTYNPNQQLCMGCNYNEACHDSVSDRVQVIRKLGVSVEMGKHLPPITEPLVKSKPKSAVLISPMSGVSPKYKGPMSVKARQVYATLEKRGVDLKAGIMGRFNPLAGKPKWLSMAFNMLIAQGGYNKADLAGCFVREYFWTKSTANSHVSICTSMFKAVNIASVDGQKVKTIEL